MAILNEHKLAIAELDHALVVVHGLLKSNLV